MCGLCQDGSVKGSSKTRGLRQRLKHTGFMVSCKIDTSPLRQGSNIGALWCAMVDDINPALP